MSDPVIISLATSFMTLIGMIITAFVTLRTGKKVEDVHQKVEDVKKATDGMSTALQAAALDKGMRIGSDDARLIAAEQKSAVADALMAERNRADAAPAATDGGTRQVRSTDTGQAPVSAPAAVLLVKVEQQNGDHRAAAPALVAASVAATAAASTIDDVLTKTAEKQSEAANVQLVAAEKQVLAAEAQAKKSSDVTDQLVEAAGQIKSAAEDAKK